MSAARRLLLLAGMIGMSSTAYAQMNTGALYTYTVVGLDNYTLSSYAEARFVCDFFCADVRMLSGSHWIANDQYQIIASEPVSGPTSWSGTLRSNGQAGTCYRASIDASTSMGERQGSGSGQKCTPPPQCHLSVIAGTGGTVSMSGGEFDCGGLVSVTATPNSGYHFVNWSGDVTVSSATIQFNLSRDMSVYANFEEDPSSPRSDPVNGPGTCNDANCMGSWEPLVLDLNGDGVNTTGTGDMVWFDLNGDGAKDHITWTNSNTMEGFLWVNLAGKNRVDDGSELFGIATVMPDGKKAKDGFQALAMYDDAAQGGNADGVIDSNDAVWNKLRVWIDINHNGVCEPGEVNPLRKYGVEAISLAAVRSTFVDADGNGHFLRGHYWRHVGGHVQLFDIDGITFQGEHH
jgi:hypothetical protein